MELNRVESMHDADAHHLNFFSFLYRKKDLEFVFHFMLHISVPRVLRFTIRPSYFKNLLLIRNCANKIQVDLEEAIRKKRWDSSKKCRSSFATPHINEKRICISICICLVDYPTFI